MKKVGKFLVLIFLAAITMYCAGIRSVFYDPPIPAKSHFENADFDLLR